MVTSAPKDLKFVFYLPFDPIFLLEFGIHCFIMTSKLFCTFSQVVKWCSQSEGGGAGDEEGPSSHDVKRHAQLVAQLLHIEWTDAKSKLVQEMNEREAKNYESLLGVRHTVGDITFA